MSIGKRRYRVALHFLGTCTYVGVFDTPEDAALAEHTMALAKIGEHYLPHGVKPWLDGYRDVRTRRRHPTLLGAQLGRVQHKIDALYKQTAKDNALDEQRQRNQQRAAEARRKANDI